MGSFYFDSCTGTAEIPFGVRTIEKRAFFNESGLKKVILPKSLRKIGTDAFCGCVNLSEILIPEGVTEIGERAFARCAGLKNAVLPQSLKRIGPHAFDFGCRNSVKINLPRGVRFLGECFLSDYESLDISDGMENFILMNEMILTKDMRTLVLCYSMEEKIIVPDGVRNCLRYAFNCNPAREIIFPESVRSVRIFGCGNLKNVRLPEKIRRLESHSIESCGSLDCLRIPSSVRKIGTEAFCMCPSLRRIEISGRTECAKNWCFDCDENIEVINKEK